MIKILISHQENCSSTPKIVNPIKWQEKHQRQKLRDFYLNEKYLVMTTQVDWNSSGILFKYIHTDRQTIARTPKII